MLTPPSDLISRIVNRIDLGDLPIDEALALAVDAFGDDPCFALPRKSRRIFEESGPETEVILLGTTPFSRILISEVDSRVKITAAVDDFRAGKNEHFEGLPIITSEEWIRRASQGGNIIAVSGCRYDRSRRFFRQMAREKSLVHLNFEQAIRLFGIHPAKDHRIDDWGPAIAARFPEFHNLQTRLSDDYSRFTLSSVLLSQLTCNPEWLLNAARIYCTLYFRSGLFVPGSQERFVDCGASIGESTAALLDATDGRFDRIWMIEPDRYNSDTLRNFIKGISAIDQPQRVILHSCALGEVEEEIPFAHQGGHGGHLLQGTSTDAGVASVKVRRLDDLLDEPPTFIKMDIEGAELSALRGAAGTIHAAHPRMAISAYHRPTDLVDLTRAVDQLSEGYRIGLRHHTEERWDTCLYFY
ncbi:MAG: FkbM family methyltransferase [Opitutaceae bacterium]